MRISYLADRPELAAQLIPGLLAHWSYVFPHQTAGDRAAKFRAHLNHDELPIAWVAHEGDLALGTAALRSTDLEGRCRLARDLDVSSRVESRELDGPWTCPYIRCRHAASA